MCDEEYSDEQIQSMKEQVARDAALRVVKGSERQAAINGAISYHRAVGEAFAEAEARDGVPDTVNAYLDEKKPYDPNKITDQENKMAFAIQKELIDLIDDDDVK